HILLRNKACDRRCRQLPDAKSKGDEQNGKRVCDRSKDGGILCAFLHQLELPVKGLHNLNNCVTHQNDGSCLHNVCLAPLQHCHAGTFQAWDLIFWKLNDKEGFSVLLSGNSLDEQSSQQK